MAYEGGEAGGVRDYSGPFDSRNNLGLNFRGNRNFSSRNHLFL